GRGENDLAHHSLRPANGIQRVHQGVRRADLVVAVRSDDKQVSDVRVRDEVLEQLEGRRVQPLEIIEKEGERVLLAGEHPQKRPELPVKTILGFPGWELRNRWLFPDDELEFGDEVHDELTIRANGLAYRVSPPVDLCLTLAQDLANEGPERLSKRGIRNVPLVLVELPGDEDPARQDDRFVQLM